MTSNSPVQPVAWLVICCCLAGCEIREASEPDGSQSVETQTADFVAPSMGSTDSMPGAGNRTVAGGYKSLEFVDGYAEGYRRAAREDKPMLVFFTAAWCKFCHEMDRDALADEEVVELSRRFVCVRVDADTQREVCKELHVRAYPTIQFVSPRGCH